MNPFVKHPEVGWTPYAWLVYLIPVILVAIGLPQGWQLPLAIAVVALFLVLYFRVYWVHGRQQLAALLAIGVLAVSYTPINPGASTLYVYTGALFGMFHRKRTVIWAVAVLMVTLAAETLIFGLDMRSWIPAAVFTPLIAALNLHFSEEGRANTRLRLAQEEVELLAKMDERERIARDLHDLLGHTLSVITIKSELAGRLLAADQTASDEPAQTANNTGQETNLAQSTAQAAKVATEIADIEALSRRAMNEVRGSVKGYRAHRMQTELAKARMALAAAQIHLVLESSPYDLNSQQETVAAHALREAITNVIRHARALQCTIRLRTSQTSGFVLEVEDDGRGVKREHGSGLTGMRERVEAIGGQLTIAPARERGLLGKGTIVRIQIPKGKQLARVESA